MVTMRAVTLDRYGPADVLHVVEVPRPVPGPGQVLVRIAATGINPVDLNIRAGKLRPVTGRPPVGTGLDLAGEIAELGPGVTDLAVGDQVWGLLPPRGRRRTGAAAEYAAVAAERLGHRPAGLPATEAAALLTTGTTALRAVRDSVGVRAGQRVLVRGAAGGVGSIAVGIAVSLGATVTGLASPRHLDLVRELGAEPLDRSTPIAELGAYDAIVDAVGTELLPLRKHLTPGGRMVSVAPNTAAGMAAVAASVVYGRQRVRTFFDDPRRPLLDDLARLVDAGTVRAAVGQVFPLAEAAAAHRAAEAGPGRQRVLITP